MDTITGNIVSILPESSLSPASRQSLITPLPLSKEISSHFGSIFNRYFVLNSELSGDILEDEKFRKMMSSTIEGLNSVYLKIYRVRHGNETITNKENVTVIKNRYFIKTASLIIKFMNFFYIKKRPKNAADLNYRESSKAPFMEKLKKLY